MDRISCLLPGGYVDEGGELHQEVELLPLGGREEEFLADSRQAVGAFLVTAILSRCIGRIGTISPVSEEVARHLLVGDRQYLLLKLRELTFGERVQATIQCPWPHCGEKIDVDFSMGDIPVTRSKNKGPVYSMKLSPKAAFTGEDGKKYREVSFRLPNGKDQERLSPMVCQNEATALRMLLESCILKIGDVEVSGGEAISHLSPLARMEIEREMNAVAPKVELNMETTCPECSREFTLPFDLQAFFFGELRISRDLLYREVHYLACHYHWSEGEIMNMPRAKRRKYIEILADEIERLNNAV